MRGGPGRLLARDASGDDGALRLDRGATDFAGRTTSFSYDADGRMLGVDYPSGTPDVAYSYDAVGNLTAMADGLGATNYTYDALNRLHERTRDGRTVGYSYDSNSQTAQIDYWGTGAVDYTYDSAGRLTSLTPWGAGPTTYVYHGTGLLAEQTRGNGVTTSYGYDSASRLTSILHAAGATNLDSLQYALDPNLLDSDFFEGRANLEGIYGSFAYGIGRNVIGTVRYGNADELDRLKAIMLSIEFQTKGAKPPAK